MEKYRHWKVTVKEYGKDNLLYPSVSGNYTKEEVIAFLGLDEPDVEWYKIEEDEYIASSTQERVVRND